MNRGSKILIAIVGILFLSVIAGYAYIHATSGLDSPLSVIMSSSMQHDNDRSQLGVIDTGDVMVIKSPSKVTIQSYVEATNTGYKTFGDYGSVIIYERGDDINPCIHRAIIWLEYNGNGTWSAESLKDYKGQWSCTSGTDYRNLYGTLEFTDITQSGKNPRINLDLLGKKSGYLTMGDNPVTNQGFDQYIGIISHPIGTDDIRSVAVMEIPWMGVIKVAMTPNKKSYLSHVPNSISSLIMLFVLVFALIYCCDMFYSKKELKQKKKKLKELQFH